MLRFDKNARLQTDQPELSLSADVVRDNFVCVDDDKTEKGQV